MTHNGAIDSVKIHESRGVRIIVINKYGNTKCSSANQITIHGGKHKATVAKLPNNSLPIFPTFTPSSDRKRA